MKIKNIIPFAASALMLVSCGIYNKYERPEVNTQGLIRDVQSDTDTLAVADTTSFGNLPWRQVFTDPQLQSLIETALAHNTDYLNCALNVKMVEAQLTMAKLAFLPSVAFSPQGTISQWDGNKASKIYSLPVSASWSLDLFGNLLNVKRSTQMQLLGMKDYQLVVKTKLITNVANMYYTLLMLDRQLEILNSMSELTQETWRIMKLQKDLGRANETSVQSAEASYYSVLTQTNTLKQSIRQAENSLSLLLGEPAQSIARGKLEDQNLPSSFSDGVDASILDNRPDVHANEMALASCFYGIESARAQFYPQLTITGTGGWSNSNGLVNPGKLLLSAVGSLVQPIFQQGKLRAQLRVSKDQYQQALNTWQQSVLSAGSEVSNALVSYNTADANDKLERQQIEVLKKNVEQTQMLYKQSSSTYLEVITAEQNLLNAQISQVQDQFSKMQSVVNLYYALGGGRN